MTGTSPDPRTGSIADRPFHLAVLDVDGTLLDSTGAIRPRVEAAVRAAEKAGCRVTLATGRRFRTAGPIAGSLGLITPLILHGGALVVAPDSGEIRYDRHLPRAVALDVIRVLTAAGRQPIIYGNGRAAERLYSGPADRDDVFARRYLEAFPRIVTRLSWEDPGDLPDPLGIGVLGDPADLAQVERLIRPIPSCRSFVTAHQRFGCHLLEVVDAGCSKAAAIGWLCDEYGIDPARVLAIGDHMNDYEMIAAAGLGVAMGDAPPALRAVARAITGTADEEGVADALERFVLGRSVQNGAIRSPCEESGSPWPTSSTKSPATS